MVVLLYLKEATLGFFTDTSAVKDMLTPGLGVVLLLISSSLVIVIPFILMIGSLTRNTVNIRIMTTIAWSSMRAAMEPQHLMHLLRLSFCLWRAASSSSLRGRSVAEASGLTCSFSNMVGVEGGELVVLCSGVVVTGGVLEELA